VPRVRLRKAHQGGLSHPSGDLRPALRRLVHTGQVPAHPRRAAPHGRGDPQLVGAGRPESPDPAGQHRHRRAARSVRADAVPVGQLGARDRARRGWPQLAPPAHGRRGGQLGPVCRLPARGPDHLPRFGADGQGRPPRPRGPAHQARLRDAGRVARHLWRRAAAAGGSGHVPVPGWASLLVLHPAHSHEARRGPGRTAHAPSRQGGSGAGAPPARGSEEDGRFPARPSAPAIGPGCARRCGRPVGGAGSRTPVQQGARQRRREGRPGHPRAAGFRASALPEHPRVPGGR